VGIQTIIQNAVKFYKQDTMQLKVIYKSDSKTFIATFDGKTQDECKNKENNFFKEKDYELVERRWIDG
jgi:hypothetical protein